LSRRGTEMAVAVADLGDRRHKEWPRGNIRYPIHSESLSFAHLSTKPNITFLYDVISYDLYLTLTGGVQGVEIVPCVLPACYSPDDVHISGCGRCKDEPRGRGSSVAFEH